MLVESYWHNQNAELQHLTYRQKQTTLMHSLQCIQN